MTVLFSAHSLPLRVLEAGDPYEKDVRASAERVAAELSRRRGETTAEHTLFASHSVWESKSAFVDWTHSEAFRMAHAAAGQSTRELYLGPPNLELFESVI